MFLTTFPKSKKTPVAAIRQRLQRLSFTPNSQFYAVVGTASMSLVLVTRMQLPRLYYTIQSNQDNTHLGVNGMTNGWKYVTIWVICQQRYYFKFISTESYDLFFQRLEAGKYHDFTSALEEG
jgi:hypothetical protein